MKFNNLLNKTIINILKSDYTPMLLGEPGIGKSSYIENLANDLNTKCFTLAANQLADKADLTGARPVPKDDTNQEWKQVFFPHSCITDAIDYAKTHPDETPILFIDEMNRTSADVTSALLSLTTSRSIGSYHLPDNLKIITAGNDKGNIVSLDKASISRFALIKVEPDANTFLALDKNLNPYIASVLRKNNDSIFEHGTAYIVDANKKDNSLDEDSEYDVEMLIDDDNEMVQLTTPRTISALSRFLNTLTTEDYIEFINETGVSLDNNSKTLLQELIEGYVGNTQFSTLLLNEIINSVYNSSTNNDINELIITKPTTYDNMKEISTKDELIAFIEQLSKQQRSSNLIYALYENKNNRTFIELLANVIETEDNAKLQTEDMQKLLQLSGANKLNKENVSQFLEITNSLSESLRVIFDYE